MGTVDVWGCHRNARAASGFAGPSFIGFRGNAPLYPMGWCGVAALFSGNLWHTTASKIRAAHQLCFILLATDPSLQSAALFLIVTSRAPFRVCLKANIGLLIGYINALNYGEEEEGGEENPWHIHLCKSFRVWKNLIQKQKPFESPPFPAPRAWLPPPSRLFSSPRCAVTVPTYQILLAASFPDTFL